VLVNVRASLPRVILCLALALIAAGLILHGLRLDAFERGWTNLLTRPNQSLSLRFLFQPLVSAIIAIRDGIVDARLGRSPYFWAIARDPLQRAARLREGIAATGKIFLIAIALDAAYQIIEFETFYPVEALIVAILLAFIPYLIIRGPAARIAQRWQRAKAPRPQA
jgi:hypothetical protein